MSEVGSILLATDFSEPSSAAVPYACDLAEQFGAELHVLHVVPDLSYQLPEFGMGLAFTGFLTNLPEQQQKAEEEAIRQLADVLPDGWKKTRVTLATRTGPAFREHHCDLIVMGTHGRGMIKHVLLGNVAERVVRHAPCPVLTVRSAAHQFEPT